MEEYWQDPIFWVLVIAVLASLSANVRSRRKATRHRKELTLRDARIADLKRAAEESERSSREAFREVQEATDGQIATVLKSAMQTLRLLAGEQQVQLDALQREYGGHQILKQLLGINHANAQFARRALGIAVLCGGFSGRRNDSASVYDVIRSAQGQISRFDRIKIRSQSGFAVVPGAVSGVALAIAELLDNAASYSPPGTTIEVNLQPVQSGLCIIIDDAGIGMSEEDRRKAAELFSGSRTPGLSDLGNPPQFGFPVVAELAQRFEFSVDVSSTSPYGGVRAVVRLPEKLLTTEHTERRSSPDMTAAPRHDAGTPKPSGRTANGLPKRAARQAPIAIVRTQEELDGRDVDEQQSSEVAAARMAAFQRGTRTGRQTTAASQEGQES